MKLAKEIVAFRLPKDLKKALIIKAKQHNRTLTNQVEDYLRIALIVEENPDLPLNFIKDILEAKEEEKAGLLMPYEFGVIR